MRASHPRTLALRGAAVITATLVLVGLVGAWGASTAEATSYRFWAYWLGSDTGWSFSNQGASRRPADGTVEGWRFAVSEASSSTTPPRHSTSFAQICGSTPPQDGKKRVGLVVDFGTATDAPRVKHHLLASRPAWWLLLMPTGMRCWRPLSSCAPTAA